MEESDFETLTLVKLSLIRVVFTRFSILDGSWCIVSAGVVILFSGMTDTAALVSRNGHLELGFVSNGLCFYQHFVWYNAQEPIETLNSVRVKSTRLFLVLFLLNGDLALLGGDEKWSVKTGIKLRHGICHVIHKVKCFVEPVSFEKLCGIAHVLAHGEHTRAVVDVGAAFVPRALFNVAAYGAQ